MLPFQVYYDKLYPTKNFKQKVIIKFYKVFI